MIRLCLPLLGLLWLCCVLGAFPCAVRAVSIVNFGAVAGQNTATAARANTQALLSAFAAANASASDRTVLVPAGQSFYVFNQTMKGLNNVKFSVQGHLILNNNVTLWPDMPHAFGAFQFEDCVGLEVEGGPGGKIDGQGYIWWWTVILTSVDHRPHLFYMERVKDVLIHNLYVTDSPQYHFNVHDILDFTARNVTIYVDTEGQKKLLGAHGLLDERDLPTFPLNTDGFDPAGQNVLIENCNIENFDDAVAVKPMNGEGFYSSCSSNMTIRNTQVTFGVGMTIGSVPPHEKVNCVRDIVFDTIEFYNPFKAIYIKTNPGTVGTGIIDNITYRNLYATASLWYPIWIGPQQQKQPGTNGTGCSFEFPVVPECPTQPLVPISNVNVIDSVFVNGDTMPGVILCPASKPCTGINFSNVTNKAVDGHWSIQQDYYCAGAQGTATDSSPMPPCLSPSIA